MAYAINPLECTGCTACLDECAPGAIALDAESELFYVISAELCTDCGDCAPVCPTSSITAPAEPPPAEPPAT